MLYSSLFYILSIQYSHQLAQLDSTDPLLYCIEAVVNSLNSTYHTCPFDGSAHTVPIDVIRSLPITYPDSPSSPFVADLSPGEISFKPRPSGLERKLLDPVPEESGSYTQSSTSLTRNKDSFTSIATVSPTKPPPQHSVSVTSFSSTFTSSISTEHMATLCEGGGVVGGCGQPVPGGLCTVCGSPSDMYNEEVCSLSVLCLGTCSHRYPSLISGHLVDWIITAITKYSLFIIIVTCTYTCTYVV